jgi:hypothetical protein
MFGKNQSAGVQRSDFGLLSHLTTPAPGENKDRSYQWNKN